MNKKDLILENDTLKSALIKMRDELDELLSEDDLGLEDDETDDDLDLDFEGDESSDE